MTVFTLVFGQWVSPNKGHPAAICLHNIWSMGLSAFNDNQQHHKAWTDLNIIAKCSQMVTVGHIGGGNLGRETSYWGAAEFFLLIWDVLEPEGVQEQVVWGSTMGPRRISKLCSLRWCQLGFVGLRITVQQVEDGFPWIKQCILLATVLVHVILYVEGGRNRWMALDGIRWRLWITKPCRTNNAPNKCRPDGKYLCSVWHCDICAAYPP